MRLSLTGTSQLEQESLLTEVHTSLKETFAQESELLKTRHQLELDQITQQNQEQQERLRVLHQQDMSECLFTDLFIFLILSCACGCTQRVGH